MPISERAKQFLPFAAVKGLDEALRRKEKEIEPKKELPEEKADELNRVFMGLRKGILVKVTYYEGERYTQIKGRIEGIDKVNRELWMEDTVISFDDVREVFLCENKT